MHPPQRPSIIPLRSERSIANALRASTVLKILAVVFLVASIYSAGYDAFFSDMYYGSPPSGTTPWTMKLSRFVSNAGYSFSWPGILFAAAVGIELFARREERAFAADDTPSAQPELSLDTAVPVLDLSAPTASDDVWKR